MLPPIIEQHFTFPQCVGELPNSEHVYRIEVDSSATSRHVVLYAAIEGDIVSAMRYQVRGCPYTIATFSYLASWCEGRSLSELKQLTRSHLIETLTLPSTKVHCAALAEDILSQLRLQREKV